MKEEIFILHITEESHDAKISLKIHFYHFQGLVPSYFFVQFSLRMEK